MKIATGHPMIGNEVILDATGVRFLTDDGRAMFEVRIGSDGVSIDVRGVDSYLVDGQVFIESLEIRPRYANGVEIRSVPHKDAK